MRALTVGALIVDGAAALALVAALAFGDGGVTLLSGEVRHGDTIHNSNGA